MNFLVVAFLLSISTVSRAVSPEYRPKGSFSNCVKNGHFALTFDDGPSEFTDGFLNFLQENKLKATFFISGRMLNTTRSIDAIKRMKRDGHTLASHTWTHKELLTLTPSEIEMEMQATEWKIYQATGLIPGIMRPPYGSITDDIYDQLTEMGYKVIMWSIDTKDWLVREFQPSSISLGYKRFLANTTALNSSWIALHHDVYTETLENLPRIINYVHQKGYEIVDMKTCLGIEKIYQNV